jgi:hypothetical protein
VPSDVTLISRFVGSQYQRTGGFASEIGLTLEIEDATDDDPIISRFRGAHEGRN